MERVRENDLEIEPVKAEGLRELEEITEFLRKSPWRSRGGAEQCVEAVGKAGRRIFPMSNARHLQPTLHPLAGAAPEDRRAPEKMRGCPPKDRVCPPIQGEMKTNIARVRSPKCEVRKPLWAACRRYQRKRCKRL